MHAWLDFLKKQEAILGKQVIEQWLLPLKTVHFDSGNLYLEAKDSFQILWFEEHIRPILKSQFINNNFRPIKVHLTVSGASELPKPSKYSHREKGQINPPIDFHFDPLDPSMTMENFVPGDANQLVFRLFSELILETAVRDGKVMQDFDSESFKSSDSHSRLVKGSLLLSDSGSKDCVNLPSPTAVSRLIASKSGSKFNPIYIWGGSGCGKTHLLTALTHAFRKQGVNALYARAETFTEHVIAAIRGSEMQSFRKAYRHVDVLLIDDVHAFSRKDATQEEFFHTFNTLHTSFRQIILSSKCPPALLEEIAPRLVSRFEWGINVHFENLAGKDLKNVLLKRCTALHFPLSDEVAEDLVKLFPSSKSLNRALDALVLRCHLNKNTASHTDTVHQILADLIKQEQKIALSPEKIISTVSAVYGIRSEDLLGKSQNQECSLPRQIAMYLCRQELKLPFQSIGQIFGRDHSTVMTSIKQIQKKIEESDPSLRSCMVEIKEKINSIPLVSEETA